VLGEGDAETALATHEEGEPPGDGHSATDNLNNLVGIAHASKMPTSMKTLVGLRGIYCDKACKRGRWYTFWDEQYGSGMGYFGPCAPRPATTPTRKIPKSTTPGGDPGKKGFDPKNPWTGYDEQGRRIEDKPPEPEKKKPEEKEPAAEPPEPKEPSADAAPTTTAQPSSTSAGKLGRIDSWWPITPGGKGANDQGGDVEAAAAPTWPPRGKPWIDKLWEEELKDPCEQSPNWCLGAASGGGIWKQLLEMLYDEGVLSNR